MPFSIVTTTSAPNLDELDQSFMYTQLLKEIILDIEHDHSARQTFTKFCINRLPQNDRQSKPIHQFEKYYKDHSPIWWYTKEPFVYSTLNKALRTQDTGTIIRMGFFLRDLHEDIKHQHSQTSHNSKIIVYRGQALKCDDAARIRNSKCGLFSFNCFLSTSTDRDVSLMFADSARQNRDMNGVLFQIEIDPSVSSTPYVSVDGITQFNQEDEILFSMHTVFRIDQMVEIDERLWEVHLTLTSDNDPQLKCLTDYLRDEIAIGNGWHAMDLLMQKMGEFDKALEIFDMLLQTKLDDDFDIDQLVRGVLLGNIGDSHRSMGSYSNASVQLEKALESFKNLLPPDNPLFATIYKNIASVHVSTGNYATALSYLEKALEIYQAFLPPNHANLATIYNNIAAIHHLMGSYQTSLSYYEKAFKIHQKSLPPNHPNFALNYNNIAVVHYLMGSYQTALSYLEKALKIQQKSLPFDHPNTAMTHINIGETHRLSGNYPLALSYSEKALEIQQKTLPADHPSCAYCYIYIGDTSIIG